MHNAAKNDYSHIRSAHVLEAEDFSQSRECSPSKSPKAVF